MFTVMSSTGRTESASDVAGGHAERFRYEEAFARNLGWITPEEQAVLRRCRVAIAGLGGVGGRHLLTLTRLGIGAAHIADFDSFELANFNRQAGATVSNLGRAKVEVMAAMARDVNPTLELKLFPRGLTRDNVGEFVAGVDIYVDSLDFFALEARRMIFRECHSRGIPAVTAAPLGMGVALMSFLPGCMSFEDYFCLEGQPEPEQLLRFLVGLAPAKLHQKSLVDPSTIDLANHRGPSTPMGIDLCAGMAAAEVLKILLKRGRVRPAPHAVQFDAYRGKFRHTWRPLGNRHPLQWWSLARARAKARAQAAQPNVPRQHAQADRRTLPERVLDVARWAPSGDNTQPWRFEVRSDRHIVVHGHDTRDRCVYDLAGRASQIAIGGLLETLRIAASGEGLGVRVTRRTELPDTNPTFDVRLLDDSRIKPDPLLAYVAERTTQRRPLRTTPLSQQQRAQLEASVGPRFTIAWLSSSSQRRQMARLLFHNAHIRLTIPEAFQVHRDVIEWNAQYSEDRMPDQAVGLDPMTLRLMRWAMASWKRVNFMNRFLGGTLAPRLQLDVMPAVRCAAHFVLVAPSAPRSVDDHVAAGGAMQRFWLTATSLGLLVQPEMTPLIFASYVRTDLRFCQSTKAWDNAVTLAQELEDVVGHQASVRGVFMGRIGQGSLPQSRSLRLPLAKLILPTAPPANHDDSTPSVIAEGAGP
jgi:sulfur-carrier protein adenylyltransferase/sulfurtransferase